MIQAPLQLLECESGHYVGPGGRDPVRAGDDGFELLVGWNVRIVGSGGAQHVFSNPTLYDTDADGLSDRAECGYDPTAPLALQCKGLPGSSGPTNPNDPDSDDDKKPDGAECSETSCTTNPLIAQASLSVSVAFTSIRVDSITVPTPIPTPGGTGGPDGDFVFGLNVQKPGQAYPGEPVLTQLTPDVLGRNVGDRIFTSSDCVSGGGAPGLNTTNAPTGASTTGIFACGLTVGRELSLGHRVRCEDDRKCENYSSLTVQPFYPFSSINASDVCEVLKDNNCDDFCSTGTFPNEVVHTCIDNRDPRAVTFPVRTGEGFVLNGFLNGLRQGRPARCRSSSPAAGAIECAQDSDCRLCAVAFAGNPPARCNQDSDCGLVSGLRVSCLTGSCDPRAAEATYCEMSFVKEFNFESLRPGFSFETFDLVSPDGKCTAKVFAEITVQ
jgi:hypothetical protein